MSDMKLTGETASTEVAHPEHTTDTKPHAKGLAGDGQSEQDQRRSIGQIPQGKHAEHHRHPLKR